MRKRGYICLVCQKRPKTDFRRPKMHPREGGGLLEKTFEGSKIGFFIETYKSCDTSPRGKQQYRALRISPLRQGGQNHDDRKINSNFKCIVFSSLNQPRCFISTILHVCWRFFLKLTTLNFKLFMMITYVTCLVESTIYIVARVYSTYSVVDVYCRINPLAKVISLAQLSHATQ